MFSIFDHTLSLSLIIATKIERGLIFCNADNTVISSSDSFVQENLEFLRNLLNNWTSDGLIYVLIKEAKSNYLFHVFLQKNGRQILSCKSALLHKYYCLFCKKSWWMVSKHDAFNCTIKLKPLWLKPPVGMCYIQNRGTKKKSQTPSRKKEFPTSFLWIR